MHRIKIFAAGNNHVFFAINQINKSVRIVFCHIAGVKPAILEDLIRGLLILIIAKHNTGAVNDQFADLVAGNRFAVFIYDFCLPAKTGLADCADLVNVFYAEVDTSRAD